MKSLELGTMTVRVIPRAVPFCSIINGRCFVLAIELNDGSFVAPEIHRSLQVYYKVHTSLARGLDDENRLTRPVAHRPVCEVVLVPQWRHADLVEKQETTDT